MIIFLRLYPITEKTLTHKHTEQTCAREAIPLKHMYFVCAVCTVCHFGFFNDPQCKWPSQTDRNELTHLVSLKHTKTHRVTLTNLPIELCSDFAESKSVGNRAHRVTCVDRQNSNTAFRHIDRHLVAMLSPGCCLQADSARIVNWLRFWSRRRTIKSQLHSRVSLNPTDYRRRVLTGHVCWSASEKDYWI